MPVIKKQQTTIDFVAQFSGTVESLFNMAVSNDISITDEPEAGTALEAEVIDQKATKVYEGKLDITSLADQQYVRPGGIDYMQIQNDFIVS